MSFGPVSLERLVWHVKLVCNLMDTNYLMRQTSTYGFKRTSTLLTSRIRKAGESRGFSVSRVLTHWEEVVGPDLASVSRPVDVGFGRGGFGATLTVLTTGANAPLLEMQKETIRERVNATYGYNAVSRVRITQTAATGFSEGQVAFSGPKPKETRIDPAIKEASVQTAAGVENDGLRQALEQLAQNVLQKQNRK